MRGDLKGLILIVIIGMGGCSTVPEHVVGQIQNDAVGAKIVHVPMAYHECAEPRNDGWKYSSGYPHSYQIPLTEVLCRFTLKGGFEVWDSLQSQDPNDVLDSECDRAWPPIGEPVEPVELPSIQIRSLTFGESINTCEGHE